MGSMEILTRVGSGVPFKLVDLGGGENMCAGTEATKAQWKRLSKKCGIELASAGCAATNFVVPRSV